MGPIEFREPLATWLLSDRGFEAGRYMEIIAPWLFMMWLMAPCQAIDVVLRRRRLLLSLELIVNVLRIGTFGVAYIISASPLGTLQIFVIVTVIGSIVAILV